jgi:hypothetical protein
MTRKAKAGKAPAQKIKADAMPSNANKAVAAETCAIGCGRSHRARKAQLQATIN